MAFSSTIENEEEQPLVVGRKKIVYGTFTNTLGSTGGNIDTGLDRVDKMFLQHIGAAVVAAKPAVNESFPYHTGNAVTIVTTADADGIWMAIGEKL